MRWFLRSAIAAASVSAFAPVSLAQYEPSPMVPPVKPATDEEPPGGFTAGLPVSRPVTTATNTLAAALPQLPPVMPAGWVPAASPPKPAPAEIVQLAIPANPQDGKRVAAGPPDSPNASESSLDRPEYLPPLLPPKAPAASPNLPKPPQSPLLPAIPLAPPVATTEPEMSVPEQPAAPGLPEIAPGSPAAEALAPGARDMPHCPTRRLCDAFDPLRVHGWLDAGYVYNSSYPDSKFNGPYNSVDRSAEPMFNQAYLSVERPLPADGSWGAGFRADALFGYDHFLGQSRGFEVDRDFGKRWNGQYYGLAIPQVYGEVGNDVISLKVGHFYTIVGYETLPSVGNFFYSHAYSYQFGQPFTHWGGILTTQLTRHWQVQAGLVNGWDALVGRANNVNFIGGLKFTPDSNRWWASFALVTGDEQNNLAQIPGVIGTDGNRTRYSFLVGLTPGGPCGKWEYVFHHYYGWQENGTPQLNFARWYGIDQYLFYRASKTLRLGTRFEWFRDEDGTRVGLNRPANPNNPPLPGNYFSLTAGFNYTPSASFLVRPEIRWDFTSDTVRRAFNDGQKNNQLLLACDVIWQF